MANSGLTKRVIIAGTAFMLTLIAFVALNKHASDPLARFVAFNESHPNLKVSFTGTVNGKAAATGVLLISKQTYGLLTVQMGGDTYKASSMPDGYLDLDVHDRLYDEALPGGPPIRDSRISSAPNFAPILVVEKTLKAVFHQTKPKITPKAGGDELYAGTKSPMGSTDIYITVNDLGEISSYRIHQEGAGGKVDRTWDLHYEFPSSIAPTEIAMAAPVGYAPYALPPEVFPIQRKGLIPVSGWKSGGATVNLLDVAGHKPFLLAIVDGSSQSQWATSALTDLKKSLPVEIVGAGMLQDPDGSRLAKLNAPGTPMFYLVDKDGKVLNLWLGFDPAKKEAFEQDIVSQASGTATPQKS